MLKNTNSSYGSVAKFLHWLIALVILINFTIAFTGMELKAEPRETLFGLGKFDWYGLHKSFGILVIVLVLIRILWRLVNVQPTLNASRLIKIASRSVHIGLYLLLIGLPLGGYLMSSFAGYPTSFFGLFTLPNLVEPNAELAKTFNYFHTELFANIFLGLIAIHILGALVHHFIFKDNTLRRILPFIKNKN
jgi:cytochrome b561